MMSDNKFVNILDYLSEIEKRYEEGYGDFIRECLTALSNNQLIVSSIDNNIIQFKTVIIDYDQFSYALFKLTDQNNSAYIESMYDDELNVLETGKNFDLRLIFKFYNLTNIFRIFDHLFERKAELNDLPYELKFHIYNYVECLLYNIDILALFYGKVYDKEDHENILLELVKYKSSTEYFNLDKAIESLESNYISMEAVDESTDTEEGKELDNVKKHRNFLKNIGTKVLKVKNVVKRGQINIKNFIDKVNIPRNMFYNKHLGKIDHLYKNYGLEAIIKENEVSDDPVYVLMNRCGDYLANLIDSVIRIYKDYHKHIDLLFKCDTYDDFIRETNRYINFDNVKLSEDAKPSDFKKSLKDNLRYNIGKAILKDHEVYGHTVESIVNKKYPPIHHVMVSLFLPRPHEHAIEQSVDSVFKSADSFKFMGKKMKDVVKESSILVTKRVDSINIDKDLRKVSTDVFNFKKTLKVDKGKLISPRVMTNKKIDDNTDKDEKDTHGSVSKEDFKKRIKVLKDHQMILESFIPIFIYVAEAGNVMFDISVRIDKTCQDAVKALLNVEKSKTDKGYDTGASKAITKDYETSATKGGGEEGGGGKGPIKIMDEDSGDRVVKYSGKRMK